MFYFTETERQDARAMVGPQRAVQAPGQQSKANGPSQKQSEVVGGRTPKARPERVRMCSQQLGEDRPCQITSACRADEKPCPREWFASRKAPAHHDRDIQRGSGEFGQEQ